MDRRCHLGIRKKEEEEEEEKDRKEKGRLASETGHNDNDRIYAKVDEENHQCFHMKLLNLVHVFLLYVESVGTCCQFHSRRTFFPRNFTPFCPILCLVRRRPPPRDR